MSDFNDAVEGFDMGDAMVRSGKPGEAKASEAGKEKDSEVSKVQAL